jgi:hypothetical protein
VKTPTEVAALLRWEPGSAEAIKANKAVLDEAVADARRHLDAIQALQTAARKLCPHKNTQAYYDPREYGWDCLDCGEVR